jgi:hypothetical protein
VLRCGWKLQRFVQVSRQEFACAELKFVGQVPSLGRVRTVTWALRNKPTSLKTSRFVFPFAPSALEGASNHDSG